MLIIEAPGRWPRSQRETIIRSVDVYLLELEYVSAITVSNTFYWHILREILAWINNHIHIFMWNAITHWCPNFNCGLVEVRAWMGNYISSIYEDAVAYPYPHRTVGQAKLQTLCQTNLGVKDDDTFTFTGKEKYFFSNIHIYVCMSFDYQMQFYFYSYWSCAGLMETQVPEDCNEYSFFNVMLNLLLVTPLGRLFHTVQVC